MRVIRISCLCLLIGVLMVSPGLAEKGKFENPRTALGIKSVNPVAGAKLVSTGFKLNWDPRFIPYRGLSATWDAADPCPCCPDWLKFFPLLYQFNGECCKPC